jgi:glycosyltransferase involved in cell wall biosynthesis
VHAHFANVATAVAMLVADFGGRGWSWSFTMHGPSEFDDVTRFALAPKVRTAAFVSCIGDYCRSQLMKLVEPEQWDKLAIVRCGIDTSVFEAVDRAGRPAEPLEVLCVGRLVPDKGQALLVEALAAVRATGRDVRLTFVGDGPDRAQLEGAAARHGVGDVVRFAGAVGQDRIRERYAAADVFCLPSFAEGIPVVLMEAMATGLPVITTHIMGVPELVVDGETGLLVMPGRADALAAAIERLADDRDLRRRLGEAGRRHVQAAFELTDAADAMRALLRAELTAA